MRTLLSFRWTRIAPSRHGTTPSRGAKSFVERRAEALARLTTMVKVGTIGTHQNALGRRLTVGQLTLEMVKSHQQPEVSIFVPKLGTKR